MARNKHGIPGIWGTSGRFIDTDEETGERKTYAKKFIPRICLDCKRLGDEEIGEFGEVLGGAYCIKEHAFPVETGKCRDFRTKFKEYFKDG